MLNKIFEGCFNINTFEGLYDYLKEEDTLKKIINAKEIEIVFDFPVSTPVNIKFHTKECIYNNGQGFTLLQIILAIRDGYKQIYSVHSMNKNINEPTFETLLIEAIYHDENKIYLDIGY